MKFLEWLLFLIQRTDRFCYYPILWMRNLRHRDVKSLLQVRQPVSQDMSLPNPS